MTIAVWIIAACEIVRTTLALVGAMDAGGARRDINTQGEV